MTRRLITSERRALVVARSPLTASILLFAAIVALRFSAHPSQRAGILLLLIGPIIIASRAYRPLAGVLVATAGLAVYLLSEQMSAGDINTLGAGTRAFTFYAIPLAIWLARRDAQRARAAEATDSAQGSVGPATPQRLTPRELEVLGLMAAGHSNAGIAKVLVVSVRTVESHRASLRRKLGRPTQPELVLHAQRWGLLSSADAQDPATVVPNAGRDFPGLVYRPSKVQ